MKHTPKGIGEILRAGRKAAGLTQGELAKKLGYQSPQFISNWEREFAKVPLKTIVRLMRHLPLHADEVVAALMASSRADLENAVFKPVGKRR